MTRTRYEDHFLDKISELLDINRRLTEYIAELECELDELNR